MGAVEKKMCVVLCVRVLQRGHIYDECDLAYGFRKGNLFVLSWTRVSQVRR